MNGNETWTEPEIDLLRRFWLTKSAGWISGQLRTHTRNAVVSKAHRLGLPSKPSPIIRTGAPRRRPRKPAAPLQAPIARVTHLTERDARAAIPAKQPAAAPQEPTRRAKAGGEGCGWTDSNRAPWVFCGAPTVDGTWCEAHRRRVYQAKGQGE